MTIFQAFLDTIFPPLCHSCKNTIHGTDPLHLCAGCRDNISPLSSPLCTCCGAPFLTEGGADHLCGPCTLSPPPYEAFRAAVRFSGVPRELIHRFKYDHKVHLAHPLALMTISRLADFVADCSADCIIPVPLHVRRLRQRGFNQAVLLGEILGRSWKVPLKRDILHRIRWTEPQINLKSEDRAVNVKGAFSVPRSSYLSGKRVLLLDDVYTTGSTVSECARTLRRAGADQVFAVTVARAMD